MLLITVTLLAPGAETIGLARRCSKFGLRFMLMHAGHRFVLLGSLILSLLRSRFPSRQSLFIFLAQSLQYARNPSLVLLFLLNALLFLLTLHLVHFLLVFILSITLHNNTIIAIVFIVFGTIVLLLDKSKAFNIFAYYYTNIWREYP